MPIGTVQWKYYKALKALKISLGNLTMSLLFAICFVISQKTEKKSSEQQQINNKQLDNNEKEESTTTKEEAIKDTLQENSRLDNVIQEPNFIDITENKTIMPWYLLGASAIFLLISIIFFIIFQKHQQKRLKKASKQ